MNIVSVKFGSPERHTVRVLTDDGRELHVPYKALENRHAKLVDEWELAGGVIEAEDPPPPPVDRSEAANQSREMRAMINAIANLTGKTPGQAAAAFKQAYNALN